MIKGKRFRRYHYKVYFPDQANAMIAEFVSQLGEEIGYTHHAEQERLVDKRGEIPKATKENLFGFNSILIEFYEILLKSGRPTGLIQKMVIRVKDLSPDYDYVYVLAREGFIVSNWANAKNDDHRIIKTMHEYYCPFDLRQTVYARIAGENEKFVKQPEVTT